MNSSIPPIKHLNILYTLHVTLGPGEDKKKGTEHVCSGAWGVVVEMDSGAHPPSSTMTVSTETKAHRGGTHLSLERQEKAWQGGVNQERHPGGGDLSSVLLE